MLLLLLGGCIRTNLLAVRAESAVQEDQLGSANDYVELTYLAVHLSDFENLTVVTIGTVISDGGSIYMFEDFWLQDRDNASAKIMVVTRFTAGLSKPSNGTFVEISGKIQHSTLEGGFYFLNATYWSVKIVPEFPTIVIVFLVPFASSLLLLVLRQNQRGRREKLFTKYKE